MIQLLIKAINYYIIFLISYFIPSIILFILDYFDFFFKFKVQNKTKQYVINVYKKCLPTVLFNSFIATIPFFIFIPLIENIFDFDYDIYKHFFDILVAYVLTDCFFFFFHKLMHTRLLYKKFHKKHHEITAPIGISAIYTTITDLYLGNLLPIGSPMFILSSHPHTIKFWIAMSAINTVVLAHSGFKWLSDFHDYHHKAFNWNFGSNVFMDLLFKTKY